MSILERTAQDGAQQGQIPAGDDAVLASLAQAEAHYKEVRASWERQYHSQGDCGMINGRMHPLISVEKDRA